MLCCHRPSCRDGMRRTHRTHGAVQQRCTAGQPVRVQRPSGGPARPARTPSHKPRRPVHEAVQHRAADQVGLPAHVHDLATGAYRVPIARPTTARRRRWSGAGRDRRPASRRRSRTGRERGIAPPLVTTGGSAGVDYLRWARRIDQHRRGGRRRYPATAAAGSASPPARRPMRPTGGAASGHGRRRAPRRAPSRARTRRHPGLPPMRALVVIAGTTA